MQSSNECRWILCWLSKSASDFEGSSGFSVRHERAAQRCHPQLTGEMAPSPDASSAPMRMRTYEAEECMEGATLAAVGMIP